MRSMLGREPEIQPDGSVLVSPEQLKLHKRTEFISFLVGAPLMLWIATRDRKLNTEEKVLLGTFAFGAIAVDTYLWARFRKAEKKREAARLRAAKMSRRFRREHQLRAR